MKYLTFKNGNKIPALGFGTWELLGEDALNSVQKALEIGYRHIDTADRYTNHRQVGKALEDSGVDRKEIFLTTKVWYQDLRKNDLKKCVLRFLEELETGYLDMLLIHWPNKQIPLKETLEAMNDLKEEGLIKNIGVSNFTEKHLTEALKSGVEVVNNQVELHPTFAQFELQKFAEEHGIILTAYSPLARGADLDIADLKDVAKKHNKSVPQVILNWIVSRGLIVIPKATKPERIKENFESLDFELTEDDIKVINSVDRNARRANPEWAEFEV